MANKTFFMEDSKAEIKKKDFVKLARLSDILDLEDRQFVLIDPLVPSGYESARKFMKHAPEVWPRRQHSVEQAIKEGRTPVQLREKAFDDINGPYFCGYSFLPLGRDRRKRKVSLIECLEGARIYAYSNQVKGAEIEIRPYDHAKAVRKEGAEIVCQVPSRTEKQRKIEFKLTSVPVIDSPEKYAITLNLGSDHSCSSKRFNIRYKYTDDKEASGIINVCAHEIAGYLKVIDYYLNEKKNMIPLQMCQFAIPSQEAVNYYLKLENNVLVEDRTLKSKDKLRKMNRAEKEIALWSLVKTFGHDKTFYSKKSRDGEVANYQWKS